MSIAPGVLFAGELTGIRLSSGPLATRIVLDLDAAASHSLFELQNPDRIVVDLPNTRASESLRLPVPKGRVRSVRTGPRPGGELRVVLDLSERAAAKSFLLPPDGALGHRLVIDLSEARERSAAEQPRVVRQEYTGRDLVVVIDAGHGGKDPGTIGRSGLREKDVVLDIARQLSELVERQPGMKSIMIRSDDRFIDLDERVRRARAAGADFFISVHADANDDSRVNGATVYSIAPRRAESEQAKRLAQRGSSSSTVGGISLSDKDETLAYVLLDLVQEASMANSMIAGNRIIERLSSVTDMLRPTVQQESLAVLTSPDIPSLLVETAFLSNRGDEANLRDAAFRKLIAGALFDGIVDYFRTNAPADSYLARNPPPEQRAPIRHVIARGETLSEIAERYRISLRELRQTNKIQGDTIRIGQVLTIPVRS